ncbi:MAG: excinuclease ABC subunit UvrC [Deltaproteobacteria bacterium]|nr:MAG: excinuclease ABC subunit UvrC [Deltaproteobacteria bacterium]
MLNFDAARQPAAPGVYLMRDGAGKVLYVGKAKNLRQRLRSYLAAERDSRPQIRFLLERAVTVETIVTDTEKEALLLENTLIKEHRPRYNIDLRDDKTFISLRLDLREEFPAFEIVRRVRADGARYFGPFTSATAVRDTLKEVQRSFPLRRLPWARCRRRTRPCLFHQVGQCSTPCHGLISRDQYRALVDGAIALLEGRSGEVLGMLRQRMGEEAAALRFEAAARLRDQIRAIEQTVERQKAVRHGAPDRDVVGVHRAGGEIEVAVLFFRQGQLAGRRSYNLDWGLDESRLLEEFLLRYYDRDVPIPDEVLLPLPVEGAEALAEWLSERRGRRVRLLTPRRGERGALLALAARNAEEGWRERGSREEARDRILAELQNRLHLTRPPRRIECFDISTLQGQATVGSMAVCVDGEPAPGEYRHYRIRSAAAGDDFAAQGEVLRRRLRRGLDEQVLPDLIVIDGGPGQLGVLQALLAELGLAGRVDAVGMAKSRTRGDVRGRTVERSDERFFLPGRKNPVILRRGAAALFFLERLRDEAHRFAVTRHRRLRSRDQLTSALDSIAGIGPQRRKLLLRHFGSVARLRAATLDELRAVPGLPAPVAVRLHGCLQDPGAGDRGDGLR